MISSWLRHHGIAVIVAVLSLTSLGCNAAPRSSTTSAPSISGFSPASGPAGTVISVQGSNFKNLTSATVGGVAAALRLSSPKLAYVTVPSNAVSGPIGLANASYSTTSSAGFTVTASAPAPTYAQPLVSGFSPGSGAVGTVVTVSGSGFTGATGARVGSSSTVGVSVASDSSLSFAVPSGAASGVITISNPQYSGSSSTSFTVTVPLTVSGFSPTSGLPGTVVTVSGTGFSGASSAQIGSSTAAAVSVASDSALSFTVPAGASSGTIRVVNGTQSATSSASFTVTTTITSYPIDEHITVDQFGYRPSATKTAVIRSPSVGYDSNKPYTPGATYRVINSADGSTVFQGTPTRWNNGTVSGDSGDFGWWFDFSSVTAPGSYYVLDVDRGLRSPTFRIDTQVYRNALKAATRMFFYQRSGFAKQTPYAEACWTDGAAFVGPNQDGQAHDVTDPTNAAKVRDLSGGWFDAGDINKYVTFAVTPVHQLLSAYEETPAAFTDDFNIPESGNGIPDVVDEVKWEIDWLKKMQNADGSALLKVGQTTYDQTNPPSADTHPHFYVPACTSATAAVAGMFAHAAWVYQKFPALQTEAADLKTRAINAYANYVAAPTKQTSCDDGTVKSGDADLSVFDQENLLTVSAVYLYALTGDTKYQDRVKATYRNLRPYNDIGWSRYVPEQGVALLFYTTLANADATLKGTILNDKLTDVRNGNQIYGVNPNDDVYRAFLHSPQYHWGSNQVRANYGNTNRDVASYHVAVTDTTPYQARAEDTLHWFHGVNPFGMVYLTNMNRLGTTHSVNTIYHTWFRDGDAKWDDVRTSSCGPAPGYLPGGPNKNAATDGPVPTYLTPPTGQPPQKSFLEWNNPAEAAWAVTEPGIYYQSAYVKLVAGFAQ